MPGQTKKDLDGKPPSIDTVPPPASGDVYSEPTVIRQASPDLLRPKEEAPTVPPPPASQRSPQSAKTTADGKLPSLADAAADGEEISQQVTRMGPVLAAEIAEKKIDAETLRTVDEGWAEAAGGDGEEVTSAPAPSRQSPRARGRDYDGPSALASLAVVLAGAAALAWALHELAPAVLK